MIPCRYTYSIASTPSFNSASCMFCSSTSCWTSPATQSPSDVDMASHTSRRSCTTHRGITARFRKILSAILTKIGLVWIFQTDSGFRPKYNQVATVVGVSIRDHGDFVEESVQMGLLDTREDKCNLPGVARIIYTFVHHVWPAVDLEIIICRGRSKARNNVEICLA